MGVEPPRPCPVRPVILSHLAKACVDEPMKKMLILLRFWVCFLCWIILAIAEWYRSIEYIVHSVSEKKVKFLAHIIFCGLKSSLGQRSRKVGTTQIITRWDIIAGSNLLLWSQRRSLCFVKLPLPLILPTPCYKYVLEIADLQEYNLFNYEW